MNVESYRFIMDSHSVSIDADAVEEGSHAYPFITVSREGQVIAKFSKEKLVTWYVRKHESQVRGSNR